MRRWEFIRKPVNPLDTQPEDLIRITITDERITVKVKGECRGEVESALYHRAMRIAEQIPLGTQSLRGYFETYGSVRLYRRHHQLALIFGPDDKKIATIS